MPAAPRSVRRPYLAVAFALAGLVACAASAEIAAKTRELRPERTYSGTLPLAVPPLMQSPITSRTDLERAWAMCSVKEPMPALDFRQRMVLATVARSSKVSFVKLALDGGDLRTTVAVAPDMPDHHTCAFAIVDRAGIKSINGAALGK